MGWEARLCIIGATCAALSGIALLGNICLEGSVRDIEIFFSHELCLRCYE